MTTAGTIAGTSSRPPRGHAAHPHRPRPAPVAVRPRRGRTRQPIHPDLIAAPEPDERLLALDAALTKLAEPDPLKARLVELRYFAGLTGDQAAQVLGISTTTPPIGVSATSPDSQHFLYTGETGIVRVIPLTLDRAEIEYRRYLTRPQPEWHAAEAERLAKANPFAATVQRSLEHRARGAMAIGAGDFDRATAHFIVTAALKPEPTAPPPIVPLPHATIPLAK